MSSTRKTQVAISVPYDNTTSGLVATNVQAAVDEALSSAAGASRGAIICGFDGSAATGRWLEFFSNNPSNANPFIASESSRLIAMSLSASTASTGTVSFFVNGIAVQSISLTASKKNALGSLAHDLLSLDEISLQVTSGSISRPTVFIFIRTLV